MLTALDRLAGALTPAPPGMTVPAIADYLGDDFTGWRTLARAPGDGRVDPWVRARLAELAELEGTWAAHAAARTADGAPFPGRAGRGHPPLAGHAAVTGAVLTGPSRG